MARKKQASKSRRRHKKHTSFLFGLGEHQPTKNKLQGTAIETGKDLLVGVVAGGVAGALIGKPSLLVGILVTGAGHYTENRLVQLLGIGMMASNGFQSSSTATVSGLEGLDGAKERVLAYQNSFAGKLYLDKFLKKKVETTATAVTNGIGEVQYFTYPQSNSDLAALDDIENQLADAALQFQGQIAGEIPEQVGDVEQVGDIEPIGDTDQAGDLGEILY